MKFECPNCSALVEPVDFKIQGSVAGWTCKECGASVSMGSVPMGESQEDDSSEDGGKREADEKDRDDQSLVQMHPRATSGKEGPAEELGSCTESGSGDEPAPGTESESGDEPAPGTESESGDEPAPGTESESGDEPGASTEEATSAEATSFCPKCGAEVQNRDDCPRCGLVFSKWNPTKLQELSDERLDPLWEKVMADFQNDAVHKKFMDTSLRLNRLDFAAAKYRGYGVSHPTKKERSCGLLEQVSTMAQFQVLRTEEGRRIEKKKAASPRNKKLIWGLVLLLLLALLYIAFLWSPKPRNPDGRDSDFKPGSQPVNLKKSLDGG